MTEPKHVHVWTIREYWGAEHRASYFACRCDETMTIAEAEALLKTARINIAALEKIEAIRNNIVGNQRLVWEAHALPLFEALYEAGYRGKPYLEARADAQALKGETEPKE